MTHTEWNTPGALPALEPGRLDVWRVRLDDPEGRTERLVDTLSTDERERAGRFYFDRERDRYLVGRAALRNILGRYTGRPAAEVRFTYNGFGKPHLVAEGPGPAMAFNLSHAAGLALVGVAQGCAVGIDVEGRDRAVDIAALAERFFTPGEARTILATDGDTCRQAFFNAWTRKEALLKAKGIGVTYGLSTFEVSVTPGEPARVLGVNGDPEGGREWTLVDVDPGEGYVAAAAVRGSVAQVGCWDWRP
jgi:4'-phosphopantetheinyl transferase